MTNYPGQPPFGSPPPPYGSPQQPAPYGMPPGAGYSMPSQKRTNGWAITALVTGLLGCFGGVTGVIAVITGIIGIAKAKTTHSGKGLAITGLILGLIFIGVWSLAGKGIYDMFMKNPENRALADDYIHALDAGSPMTASDGGFSISQSDIDEYKKSSYGAGGIQLILPVVQRSGDEATVFVGVSYKSGMSRQFLMTQAKEGGVWKVKSFALNAGMAGQPAGYPAPSTQPN